MWDKQGAISGPVFASEDAKEGARRLQGEARAGLEGRLAASSVAAALAPALGHDRPEAAPEGAHQRSPGVLRGYWEIGTRRSMAVVRMRFCSSMWAAG